MQQNKTVNMTEGPILRSVIVYSIPIILGGMIQIFFNAADLAVVGHFANSIATASVGATSSSISLVVNTILGLSVGINVVLGRALGSGDEKRAQKVVHTSIAFSLVAGLVLAGVGFFLAEGLMILTKCPENAFAGAVGYMRIYFLGAPGILAYNFASAILRSKGDTRRPLYYLIASGVANIGLNLIFVAIFHLDALGVAIATAVSQYMAAGMTIYRLTKETDACRFIPRETRIHAKELRDIIRYGLASSVTNAMFSISNLQIQSAVNSYGDSAVAGNAACASIEGFAAAGNSAFNAAIVAFLGQNVGAGKKARIKKIILCCLLCSVTFTAFFGLVFFTFGGPIFRAVYLPKDAEAVRIAIVRTYYLLIFYWVPAAYGVIGGAAQALGYSFPIMLNSIFGVCVFRTIWMQLIYPKAPSLHMLYICYPVTWGLILLLHSVVFFYAIIRYYKKGVVR